MKIYRGVDAMRPLPIFKPEMRKANRDGLKSITRRVIDPQPVKPTVWMGKNDWEDELRPGNLHVCKYGKVGDVVYMREPLVQVGAYAFYKDDSQPVISVITGEMVTWRWKVKTLSGMFMPGEAARFVYRYESIRVERVQEISEADAVAEGLCAWQKDGKTYYGIDRADVWEQDPRLTYKRLWNSINDDRGFGWDANPWVWVLEYKAVV
jgi:hypothetical protein